MNKLFKSQTIMFIIMVLVGIFFNPMNILAFRLNDLYLSYTLFYGGLLMASNMIWAHEIVHYLSMGNFNLNVFIIHSVKINILSITRVIFINYNFKTNTFTILINDI